MNPDKKRLYMVSSALVPAFLLVCFITKAAVRRLILTAVVIAALVAVLWLIKKRTAKSLNKKQLIWVLPMFGFLGIVLLYTSGTVFGFHRVIVNSNTLLYEALPFVLIIVGSELIRSVLLMQGNRAVSVFSLCAFVLCDVAMLYEALPFANFKLFVSFFGDIVFPCIASGILFQYVSRRYGAFPVITYRLLMTLYSVLIPFYPSVPSAMMSFLKISFPIMAILFIGLLYERKKQSFSRKKAYIQFSLSTVSVLLMAVFMMLLSCQFRYGMLIVATESMTGSIDKGDAIIYEEYESQPIEKGQVIVFEKNQTVYIHRVVDIENIDGQVRYITKGDANDSNDTGFITKKDIIGLTDTTIKYIGQPTLWARRMFQKNYWGGNYVRA